MKNLKIRMEMEMEKGRKASWSNHFLIYLLQLHGKFSQQFIFFQLLMIQCVDFPFPQLSLWLDFKMIVQKNRIEKNIYTYTHLQHRTYDELKNK